MSRKMLVNRLSQDELVYEVRVRGIATGTVQEMRHSLSMAIRLEEKGESLKYPKYPFTVEEDIAAVTAKLEELEPLIDTFSDSMSSNAFARLQSKMFHVLNRLDNISEEDTQDKPKLLAKALALLDNLHRKAEDYQKTQDVPPFHMLLGNSNFGGSLSPHRRSSDITPTQPPTVNVKPILPNKWDCKFSGDKKGMSLCAFLSRVEELRVARHVSKEVLLDSGIDLFTGRAYQFYTAYRREVSTWDEFVALLREEYLSSNYDEKLFEEIKKRTQGPDESIGIYLAVMTGYFNRLTCSISEEVKLKILLRNIAPFYQTQLALVDVTSINHLRELGRRLEARKEAVENFSAPSKKFNALEPDLAYVQVDDSMIDSCGTSSLSHAVGDSDVSRSDQLCFKCNKPGHRAVGCLMKSAGLHCYRCKKKGFTIRSCPNCSSTGNGRRRT
ncbi:uncharacterized protein [Leptinotarsa decemlineata]|uniref:uncharacterized protein n=1 Tax=Leptinotarsa decemlineata TaxID=7539 RepID=UPI003D30AB0F